MEGLIKGLIDVALGGGGGDNDGDDNRRGREEEQQRSRSSWAEQNEEEQRRRESYSRPNAWNSEKQYERTQQDDEELRWQQHESTHLTRLQSQMGTSHQPSAWSSEKEDNDGQYEGQWEVVGQKKKHHPMPQRLQKVQVDTWNDYKRNPSEQNYMEDSYHHTETETSDMEIDNLSKACSRLWKLDLNRLVPGKDYEIDCGEGKKVYQKGDMADGSLFQWVNDDVFRRPTYARFCSLLDNYNPQEGYKEVITTPEKNEQAAFIEEISRTAPIKYLHKYLVAKGIGSQDYEEFKEMLKSLWFDLYGRGGSSGSSSAFEHVFVGEIKGRGENEVSGFHNWIQFYLEEAKGRVDYQGYIFPRRHQEIPNSDSQLLTIQFEWNGILKSVSSTLIGVSPEFEVALYTLCFFVGQEDNRVCLGPYPVNIKCYRFGRGRMGSVFPIAEC